MPIAKFSEPGSTSQGFQSPRGINQTELRGNMRTVSPDSFSGALLPFARKLYRFVSNVLVFAIVIGTARGETRATTNDPHPKIQDMGFFGAGTGWILQGHQILWTRDNGENWTDITPGAPLLSVDGVFFLNSFRGWSVLSQLSVGQQSPVIFMASTSDAGRSWGVRQIGEGIPEDFWRYTRESSLFFADPLHGWLAMRLASSSNFSMGLLFTTADGGTTWRRLPDPPSADPVYFKDTLRGWLAGGPAGDKLWKTDDAGTSWTEQTLVPPSVCPDCKITHLNPTFSSKLDAMLPVQIEGTGGSFTAVYVSHDEGTTWTATDVRALEPGNEQGVFFFVAGTSVFELKTYDNVFVTSGREDQNTTAGIPPEVWPMGQFGKTAFVSPAEGWVIYSAGRCLGIKAMCSQQHTLLSTNDGGMSYRSILRHSGSSGEVIIYDSEQQHQNSLTGAPHFLSGRQSNSTISVAEGFDMACVASEPNMLIWWQYSPYYDTGVYVGGSNLTCKANTYLNSTWVNLISGMGWGIMPLWVGLQSPCIANSKKFWTIPENDPAHTPYQEGQNDAAAAASMASSLGMYPSTIYFDMEYYNPSSTDKECSPSVISFLQGWATQLHADGYGAGLYGSLGDWWTSKGASDFIQLSNLMDDVWISQVPGSDSVLNIGKLPNTYWPNNQRIHQYAIEPTGETWGGVEFGGAPNTGIDRDVEDAPVFSWGGDRNLPAPILQTPANGAAQQSTTPTFSWTAVSGATNGYRIMVAADPSFLPTNPAVSTCPNCAINYPAAGQTLTTSSYTPVTGILQPGLTYWWQVQVIPQAPKLGDWSAQSTVSLGALANQVQGLTIDPSIVSTNSHAILIVSLNGISPAGGTTVQLYTSNPTAFPLPSAVQVSAGASSATVNVVVGSVTTSTQITASATYNGVQVVNTTIVPVGSSTVTSAPTNVGVSSGVMNGTINPAGASGFAGFEWGTDSSMSAYSIACPYGYLGYCPSVTQNSTTQSFSYPLSNLVSSTTYYFRIVFYDTTHNSYQYGAIQAFATMAPIVTTQTATLVTDSTALLNGTVNPQGAHGNAGFEWGTDPTMSNYYVACPYSSITYCPTVNPISTAQAFTTTISGLSDPMTYYARTVFYDADNGSYWYGSIVSLTTNTPPTITTAPATSMTAGGGVINGSVNPKGDHGYVGFAWGTDPAMGNYSISCPYNSITYCPTVNPNSLPQAYSAVLTGLASNTTYYYRVVFLNSDTNTYQYSTVASLKTLAPTIVTLPATSVTSAGAALSGTVNPQGANGTAGMIWGTDPTMTSYNVACISNSFGYCPVVNPVGGVQPFSFTLNGLNTQTHYYFQMVFYDSDNGSYAYGSILSFFTQ
jgi:photosystem II stability/assembly factor-like uncharacterized protein